MSTETRIPDTIPLEKIMEASSVPSLTDPRAIDTEFSPVADIDEQLPIIKISQIINSSLGDWNSQYFYMIRFLLNLANS